MADKDRAPTQADFEKAWADVKAGRQQAPSFNDMEPLPSKTVKPPVRMPELKTKDTGDKNEVELKGQKIKGYENAKPMKKGGSVSSASKRADGIATKGKTKGRII